MNDRTNQTGSMPGVISIAGAIGVLAAYWLHLFIMDMPLTDQTGLSLTVFFSAFIAQYIPLKTLENEYHLRKR